MWVHCAVEKGRWGSVEEVVVDAMVAAIVGRECRVDSLAVAVLVKDETSWQHRSLLGRWQERLFDPPSSY